MGHDEKDRLDKIDKTLDSIQQNVTEIKLVLVGSEQLKTEGIIQKVNEHDKYIEKDKKQKWMIAGALAVLTFLAKIFKFT